MPVTFNCHDRRSLGDRYGAQSFVPPPASLTQPTRPAYLSNRMPSLDQDHIGIVGLGAIGGSLALALRDRGRISAWSSDAVDRDAARAAGVHVCEPATWLDEMRATTATVLAVPIDELPGVIRELAPTVPDECVLVHASSLQDQAALGLNDAEFARVVGTHPMAGSERSGFSAASPQLFQGATLRAEARASTAQRMRIETLWRTAGVARIIWDDAAAHDALMAWVSHLPQLTSIAIGVVLSRQGVAYADLGPGGRAMARLAASDLRTWAPILHHAPPATADALRHLTNALDALRESLDTPDPPTLTALWEEARGWRSVAGESA